MSPDHAHAARRALGALYTTSASQCRAKTPPCVQRRSARPIGQLLSVEPGAAVAPTPVMGRRAWYSLPTWYQVGSEGKLSLH